MRKAVVVLSLLFCVSCFFGNANEIISVNNNTVHTTTYTFSTGGKKHKYDSGKKKERKKKLKRRRGRRSYGVGKKNGYSKRYNPFNVD